MGDTYKISAADSDALLLGAADRVRSVMQTIRIILTTPKGTVPLYRDFGIDMSFLDMPIPGAEQRARIEIWEAIEKWEPRATVTDVTFDRSAAGGGRLIPTVEVTITSE